MQLTFRNWTCVEQVKLWLMSIRKIGYTLSPSPDALSRVGLSPRERRQNEPLSPRERRQNEPLSPRERRQNEPLSPRERRQNEPLSLGERGRGEGRLCRALLAAAVAFCSGVVTAQTVLDSPELYAGEKALYEAAKKEGMVVSFDTGPTWANWAAEFTAFKKRYPEV